MAENMKKREARIQKAGGVIGGVIGIASIVFAMAVVVFSGVSVKLTGTALELSGGIGDRASIPYTEITGVEWRDVFDKGSRTWGTGTGKISSGTFTNDEFGAYRLYLPGRVAATLIVRHGADETTDSTAKQRKKTKRKFMKELASRADAIRCGAHQRPGATQRRACVLPPCQSFFICRSVKTASPASQPVKGSIPMVHPCGQP